MCSTLDDLDLIFGIFMPQWVWISGRNMNVILMSLAHELCIRTDLFQRVATVKYLTTLPSESPASSLELAGNACTNPSPSAYSWAHLLPRTELLLAKRVSVYNLTFNLLSFWSNIPVRYILVSGNMADLTFICVVTSKVALAFSRPIPNLQEISSALTSLWRLS